MPRGEYKDVGYESRQVFDIKAIDNYLTAPQLPGARAVISVEERLSLIKQDPIFKTVSLSANILFVDGHIECIHSGNPDGTTNTGWPNKQAGKELIWDPDDPGLP
ncbi:MAG TPA: hypothetical protein ACFYDZ_04670 [Candidatus Brocadiaceae bacterium]